MITIIFISITAIWAVCFSTGYASCCPKYIPNGQLASDCDPIPVTACNFTCNEGYSRRYNVNRLICLDNLTWNEDERSVCAITTKDNVSDCNDHILYGLIGASIGALLMVVVMVPVLVYMNIRVSRLEVRMAIRSSLDAIYRRRLFPSENVQSVAKSGSRNITKTYCVPEDRELIKAHDMPDTSSNDDQSLDNFCTDCMYENTKPHH